MLVLNVRLLYFNFNVSYDGDYVVIVLDFVLLVGMDIILCYSYFDLFFEKLFENFIIYFIFFEWMII